MQKKLEIKMINVKRLQRGGNPRKHFDKDDISKLARSYKQKGIGVIVPLQITSNHIVILGERRWRAAKRAKLKKVPCIIHKGLSEKEILTLQCIEEAHKKKWSHEEKYKAWKKLLSLATKTGEWKPKKTGGRKVGDKGLKWLAKKLGVAHSSVIKTFKVYEEGSPETIKDVEEKKIDIAGAARLAGLEPEEQRMVLKEIEEKGIKTQTEKTRFIKERAREIKNARRKGIKFRVKPDFRPPPAWLRFERGLVGQAREIREMANERNIKKFLSMFPASEEKRLLYKLKNLHRELGKFIKKIENEMRR